MIDKPLTVILPCAGEGSRLGLSGPKELFEVEPGMPMIRYTLDLLLAGVEKTENKVQIAVVIREGKEAVVQYVKQGLPEAYFEVKPVVFDSSYREWPGSIYSARAAFSEHNVVLLPDSYLTLSETDRLRRKVAGRTLNLLQCMSEQLEKRTVVFGVKSTLQDEILNRLGAVEVNESTGEVLRFQDKPLQTAGYNGVWGCFGFRKSVADELHRFLMESVLHRETNYPERSFYPAGSFEIEDYNDLGTWESIERFRSKYVH